MRAERRIPEAGALPLVMLPGTLCNDRIFEPLRRRLTLQPSQVIVTQHARSLEQAAEEVLAQAPEYLFLLGFSLGGMVAMEAALRAPERVCGLILLSTTPLPVPRERHAGRRALVNEARTLPMRQFTSERLWSEYGGAPGDTSTLPVLEQMAEELGAETFACQTEMALGRSDFYPRLQAISCPTLIVAGAEDVVCPPSAQTRLSMALPTSSCVLLPNCGHFAILEQPDEVATTVAAWLHTFQSGKRNGRAAMRSNREGD